MEWVIIGLLVALLGSFALLAVKLRDRFRHLDSRLERLEARLLLSTSKDRAALADAIRQGSIEVQNTVSLGALRFELPVFYAGWSIDSFLARHLVQHLMERRPKVIVELGSGTSTLLIARCVERLGYQPVHVTVDHEQRYLDLTRESARVNGLDSGLVFVHCPLGSVPGFEQPWYVGLPEKLSDVKIDLLVIDGPPASTHRLARYPALPVLYSLLSPECTVLLDDARRSDEQAIVRSWLNAHSEFEVTSIAEGHGVAVLSRRTRV